MKENKANTGKHLASADIRNMVLCIIYELQRQAMLTDQGKNVKINK